MRPFRLHRRSFAGAAVLPAVLAVLFPITARAQSATVRIEENFRASPNGAVVGTLSPGAPLTVESRQGAWTQVTITGYVYVPSLQVWTDGEFDLVVSEDEGENLRAEPAGTVLGRLEGGALLDEVRRIPGWIEVRRTGWIWSASIEDDGGPPASVATPAPSSVSRGEPVAEAETTRSGAGSPPLLATPGGDTLATVGFDVPLEILERDGDWGRVRFEGWIWLPGLTSGPGASQGADPGVVPGAASGAASVSAAELTRDPAAYEGRVVELVLEFISLERAERIRTDFYEGEPFLLTRFPDAGQVFVYVAVPPERLAEVEGIAPLETIRVSGRVRAASATLTGNPVLDLLTIAVVP